MEKTALITGASSGIGAEFARLHAERGGDVVLVARRADKLEAVAADIRTRLGREARVVAADLTDESAPAALIETLKRDRVDVEYLVNNAGFGGRGRFHEREWVDDRAMIQLNIVALTALTRLVLPDFVARNRGRILNVSSIASLMPGPLQAVYFATKAYVTSFSNAVAEELSDTNVTVTALMPGATQTEFAAVSDMEKTDLFKSAASARAVAQVGYDAMMAGKREEFAGLTTGQRLMMNAAPLMPKSALMKRVKQMQSTPA